MKNKLQLTSILIFLNLLTFAQKEKEIESKISQVTVYTQGAQIEREASFYADAGETILKFTGLSPYINKESIRVDGESSYTIQNVLQQNDFLNELEKSKEIKELDSKKQNLKLKIEDERTQIDIIDLKLDFLKTNKDISGKEQALSLDVFQSVNSFYGTSIENLLIEKLKRSRKIDEYNTEITKLDDQSNSISTKTELPSGTILITVNSKQSIQAKIKFNYLVSEAMWYPSYDMRFQGTDKPLSINYKGNISQNTGVDWKNVKLVLSSAKTNISAQIPELFSQNLGYYNPELYNLFNQETTSETANFDAILQGNNAGVSAIANSGRPGATSTVTIRGVGSISDGKAPLYIIDGVPVGSYDLSSLNPNNVKDVKEIKGESAAALYGSKAANGVILITTKSKKDKIKTSNENVTTSRQETLTEFTVKEPHTILSSEKTNVISFKEAKINADFEYQSVPKLSDNVYLIGRINDWSQAELMTGMSNIYLENSYVGKSYINTKQFRDTLEISFGIDNNITIKREKLKEFSETKFIGSNKKETIAYKITLRNNKSYKIKTKISDQIPISTDEDIKVEILDISEGKLNTETGKIDWEVELEPNKTKEMIIKFSIRYPKDKQVLVD